MGWMGGWARRDGCRSEEIQPTKEASKQSMVTVAAYSRQIYRTDRLTSGGTTSLFLLIPSSGFPEHNSRYSGRTGVTLCKEWKRNVGGAGLGDNLSFCPHLGIS